jgi:hypothetical protein
VAEEDFVVEVEVIVAVDVIVVEVAVVDVDLMMKDHRLKSVVCNIPYLLFFLSLLLFYYLNFFF